MFFSVIKVRARVCRQQGVFVTYYAVYINVMI